MGQKQTKARTSATGAPCDTSDHHKSVISRPEPPRHMYHFSELSDLNELSRQTKETNYTRRTVRLVSDSISDRTLGDDTTHGIKQGINIDETMPLSPSDGLLGHEGPRSVSGITIISSQLDASQHSEIRQTSDI